MLQEVPENIDASSLIPSSTEQILAGQNLEVYSLPGKIGKRFFVAPLDPQKMRFSKLPDVMTDLQAVLPTAQMHPTTLEPEWVNTPWLQVGDDEIFFYERGKLARISQKVALWKANPNSKTVQAQKIFDAAVYNGGNPHHHLIQLPEKIPNAIYTDALIEDDGYNLHLEEIVDFLLSQIN